MPIDAYSGRSWRWSNWQNGDTKNAAISVRQLNRIAYGSYRINGSVDAYSESINQSLFATAESGFNTGGDRFGGGGYHISNSRGVETHTGFMTHTNLDPSLSFTDYECGIYRTIYTLDNYSNKSARPIPTNLLNNLDYINLGPNPQSATLDPITGQWLPGWEYDFAHAVEHRDTVNAWFTYVDYSTSHQIGAVLHALNPAMLWTNPTTFPKPMDTYPGTFRTAGTSLTNPDLLTNYTDNFDAWIWSWIHANYINNPVATITAVNQNIPITSGLWDLEGRIAFIAAFNDDVALVAPVAGSYNGYEPTNDRWVTFEINATMDTTYPQWRYKIWNTNIPMRQRQRDDGFATDNRHERGNGSSLQSSLRRSSRTYY